MMNVKLKSDLHYFFVSEPYYSNVAKEIDAGNEKKIIELLNRYATNGKGNEKSAAQKLLARFVKKNPRIRKPSTAKKKPSEKMVNPQSYPIKNAAYWASEMARLRAMKPSSLARYCGKNQESGCVSDWERRMKIWSKAYRHASKQQKIELEKDNATFYSSKTTRKNPVARPVKHSHKLGFYVEYQNSSNKNKTWETYGLFRTQKSAEQVCVLLAEQNPGFAVRVMSQ
jgi:hypothetical protein